MRTINNLLQAVRKVDLPTEMLIALEENARGYVTMQKEQLFEGKNQDGREIEPFYAPSTVAIKKRKGQPVNRVTLRDTGSFYDGILVDVRSEGMLVDSADEKTEKLVEKYGEEIFGLADNRKQLFAEDAGKTLVGRVKDQLNGK